MRDVCLCPGSRSTPVAVAVQRHPALRTWIHLDERSCAYFALGLAQGGDAPVALLCTSGGAALNFAPAVAEAATAGLPLVVLTADRPPELRGVGANQTVDQLRLYGGHAKAFAELPLPVAGDAADAAARHWGRRAPVLATAAPAGPVHLNLPFREPLIPDLPPPAVLAPDRTGPPPRVEPAAGDVAALAALVGERRRGLIVAGPQHAPDSVQAITGLAAALGYPILADPLSQLRRGPHDRGHVIAGYDAMLRAPAGPDAAAGGRAARRQDADVEGAGHVPGGARRRGAGGDRRARALERPRSARHPLPRRRPDRGLPSSAGGTGGAPRGGPGLARGMAGGGASRLRRG